MRSQICNDFFFFQAEDGIRDDLVTGVQTCALPIFVSKSRALVLHLRRHGAMRGVISTQDVDPKSLVAKAQASPSMVGRSEERRVGKECRCQWQGCHSKKKDQIIVMCWVRLAIIC